MISLYLNAVECATQNDELQTKVRENDGEKKATLAEKFQSLKKEKLAYVPEDYNFFFYGFFPFTLPLNCVALHFYLNLDCFVFVNFLPRSARFDFLISIFSALLRVWLDAKFLFFISP